MQPACQVTTTGRLEEPHWPNSNPFLFGARVSVAATLIASIFTQKERRDPIVHVKLVPLHGPQTGRLRYWHLLPLDVKDTYKGCGNKRKQICGPSCDIRSIPDKLWTNTREINKRVFFKHTQPM
jgi:hypothetical protein